MEGGRQEPRKNKEGLLTCLDGFSTTNYCARCYALAERDGQMGWYHDDGRDNDWQTNTQATGHLEGMCRVVPCGYGCKVYQCRDCFRMEDGDGNPLPDAWMGPSRTDRQTRSLMGRRIVCE